MTTPALPLGSPSVDNGPVGTLAQADTGALTETSATLRFLSAPEAWVTVLVILPLVAAVVWFIYSRERGRTSSRSRLFLGLLRGAILLLLVLILFQPVLMTSTERVLKQKLVFLVDDSSSMQERDPYGDEEHRETLRKAAGLADGENPAEKTRAELVKGVLENGVLEAAAERFDARIHAFDNTVRRNVSVDDLRSEGTSTRIGSALNRVYSELVGQPAAGVVLITDGQSNEGNDPVRTVSRLLDLQQIQIPLIAVGVGDPAQRKDVQVKIYKPNTGEEFLIGDQIPFTIEIQATGYEDRALPLKVEIFDGNRRVATQNVSVNGAGGTAKEVVFVKAEREGRRTFTAKVPVLAGEADDTDNVDSTVLRVIKKRIKVLYAEGYPRWEYRYLKNALVRDNENYAVHIVLVSAERDFVQEASPDLDPIFTFPQEAKDLFEYDVIILGDVNPENLAETPGGVGKVLGNLAKFVSDVGGGLLMLSGEGWNPHSYVGTPLEKVLPIVPGTRGQYADGFQRAFRPRRTALGENEPLLRVSKDPQENLMLWEDPVDGFPPVYWFSSVERAKPGARVLLVHPEAKNRFGPQPLFVSQFYGKGRSIFLGLDSLWRWRKFFGDRYFYQFYSQSIRYLATTKLYRGNKRYEIFTDKHRYDVGETIRLNAAVRDQDFNPSKEASQTIYWQGPRATRPQEIELTKVKDGEYESAMMASARGRHTIWIKENRNVEARADEYTFEVDITPLEKAEPAMNSALLEELAGLGNQLGSYELLHDLPSAIERLEARTVRIAEKTNTRDAWDRWWLLCLVSLLLTVEWVYRKRFRLQ